MTWDRWVPAVLFAGVIYFLSVQPAGAGPSEGGIPFAVLHFGAYAVLSVFVFRGFGFVPDRVGHTILVCGLFGLFIEIHQLFLPTRYFGVDDVLMNVGGAVAGVVAPAIDRKLP